MQIKQINTSILDKNQRMPVSLQELVLKELFIT